VQREQAYLDEIIPYQNSQRLYELADQPKKFLLLEGGEHRAAPNTTLLCMQSLWTG